MSPVAGLFERSTSTLVFDDRTRVSSGELLADGRAWATALAAAGLERGDRVAIRLPNGADYVRLLLACAVGGYVAVSVNTRYSDAEVRSLIERSGAQFVHPEPAWSACAPMPDRAGADDAYLVFTTSGTTSRPKMVLHTQRSIADHAHDVAHGFGYRDEDVAMVVMPLCGTFGLASLTAAVAGGGTVVVTDFDVVRTSALVAEHQVTVVNGSDDMFHRLLAHGADLRSIRLAGYARFNSSLDGVVADAEHAGTTLTGLYGMSEVQALFALRDPSVGHGDRARAGGTLVSDLAAYRIIDDELEVRGPSLMAGYLAEGGATIDRELTARHVVDGWFRTGDVARADDDRTFEYLTRRGDAMRLGGFLVDPSEIETVVADVPGVEHAQVVAVDRPGGARPVAFVIGSCDEADVIAACRDQLAIYKVPIRVVEVAEFPSTPSANGTKIQRGRLRSMAEHLLADTTSPGTPPHSA